MRLWECLFYDKKYRQDSIQGTQMPPERSHCATAALCPPGKRQTAPLNRVRSGNNCQGSPFSTRMCVREARQGKLPLVKKPATQSASNSHRAPFHIRGRASAHSAWEQGTGGCDGEEGWMPKFKMLGTTSCLIRPQIPSLN